jgi:phosphoglycerol transferase MdoB-like AlkP superfamily enzyme
MEVAAQISITSFWFNYNEHKLITVGALTVIWSLWLCRNDKVFTDKNYYLMQVIYICTAILFVVCVAESGEL